MKEAKVRPLLIIPAYNEAENIEKVVNNISINFPQYDYIVVNDGSVDETSSICAANRYNVLNLPINLGIGGAVQAGYCYAARNNYEIAVQIDGDGQHDVSEVESAIGLIANGTADVVIGSRFLEKKGFQTSALRRIGIQILSVLIWVCTGEKIRDVTSGFRAVNRRYIDIYSREYSFDYPEPEAIVTAVMYGAKIKEIPVIMHEREKGTSSISFWKSVYYMLKVSLAILVRRVSYGVRRNKKGVI